MLRLAIVLACLLLVACSRGDTAVVKPTLPPAPVAAANPTAAAPASTSAAPAPAHKPTDAPAPTAPPVPTSAPANQRVVIAGAGADGVNMRAEPSTTAARVKLLHDGAPLDIVGEDRQADSRTWRNVKDGSDGATGWIAADFLSASAPPPAAPAAAPAPTDAPKPAAPAPTAAPKPAQAAPPKPAGGTTCGSYPSQAAAQAAYRANPIGLRSMDADGDGVACETNPAPRDTSPVRR